MLPNTSDQRVRKIRRIGMLIALPIQLGLHHLAAGRAFWSLRSIFIFRSLSRTNGVYRSQRPPTLARTEIGDGGDQDCLQ